MEATAGPPSHDGAASLGLPGDGDIQILLVPLHLGMAPASGGMPPLRTAQGSNDAVQMPVPQAQVEEGPPRSGPAMEATRGALLHIINGVPRSHTCIAVEGEGTHDYAAIPADHVHVLAAM